MNVRLGRGRAAQSTVDELTLTRVTPCALCGHVESTAQRLVALRAL